MPWVKLTDDWYDDPKIIAAGPVCLAMWIVGISWCARNLTDGLIPDAQVRRLIDWDGIAWRVWNGDLMGGGETVEPFTVADELVARALWNRVDGGYVIANYLRYQPSRAKVEQERAEAAERMRKRRPTSPNASAEHRANTNRSSDEVQAPRTRTRTRTRTTSTDVGSSLPTAAKTTAKHIRAPGGAHHSATDPDQTALFDHWWSGYPRKVAKKAALKAYKSALKRATPESLLAGLATATAAWAREARETEHIPHASTWLNQDRWLDEHVDQPRTPREARGLSDWLNLKGGDNGRTPDGTPALQAGERVPG
jgi:hypothetical protein